MNLCILDSGDSLQRLPATDRRAQHIVRVLKKREGEKFRAGSPDGLVGWASLESSTDESILLRFEPENSAPSLRPVHLMLGTVRPIQAARIVKELTILGVGGISFFPTELGEKSYTQSNFYTQREYDIHARDGAEQAGNPRVPEIGLTWSLKKALEHATHLENTERHLPGVDGTQEGPTKIICHPSRGAPLLSSMPLPGRPVILAIGTERGWTDREISQFVDHGFAICSLGDRILKTETAAIAAASIVLARLGYI